MKNKLAYIAIIIAISLLLLCAAYVVFHMTCGNTHLAKHIRLGMTKDEVKEMLGEPNAFTGGGQMDYVYYLGDGSIPWGLSSPLYGLAAVADHRSVEDELITLIHEFGHLVGAPDHYGGSGDSTQSMNDSNVANAEFYTNCLYGESQEDIRELSQVFFCPGCREFMHNDIVTIQQGEQGGDDNDDRVVFS